MRCIPLISILSYCCQHAIFVHCWTSTTTTNDKFPPSHVNHHHHHHRFRLQPDCPLKTSSTSLSAIPLSSIPSAPFLSSSYSDSYRICIDSHGRFYNNSVIVTDTDSDTKDDSICYYTLGIAQEDDLPSVSRLTIDCFGAEAITFGGGEFSPLEKALLQPGIYAFNAYTNVVAYAEVLSGLRKRTARERNRQAREEEEDETNDDWCVLDPPLVAKDTDGVEKGDVEEEETETKKRNVAAQSSLVLILFRPSIDPNDGTTTTEIIASVELRLQPTDAKIPFSLPWYDSVERRVAKLFGVGATSESSSSSVSPSNNESSSPLKPYLSNLCVTQSFRGQKIGKALVRCVEAIARESWGYDVLYLHVDPENEAARVLYEKEGYKDVGKRWDAFWVGGAKNICYFYKRLE